MRRPLHLVFVFCFPACVYAVEPLVKVSTETPVVTSEIQASSTTPENVGPTSPNRVLPGEPTVHKNYLMPALEIPLFQLTLNGLDRALYGPTDYGSNLATGWDHVRKGPWVVDQDDFSVNQ